MKSIAHCDPVVNGSHVPACAPAARTEAASAALLAANRRLLARRAAGPASVVAPSPALVSALPDNPALPDHSALPGHPALPDHSALPDHPALPDHLGWHSHAVCRALPRPADSAILPPPVAQPQPGPPVEQHVKAYPALLAACLRADLVPVGRIWLLARYLDRAGRGWLAVETLRRRLTGGGVDSAESAPITPPLPHKVCGWRRLRQIIRQGTGTFWSRDAAGRLWLHGAARVAARLGVDQLTGHPVYLPLAVLTGPIGPLRAHFYASIHSGRPAAHAAPGNPISRRTLHRLTAVPPRTQRAYDRLAGVRRTPAIAVGARQSATGAQEQAWQRGRTLFTFIDHRGRHGPAGARYPAWHLPNRYRGSQTPAPRGRHKKINRQLRHRRATLSATPDLVLARERGNGRCQRAGAGGADGWSLPRRLFHADGHGASRAHGGQPALDAYWPARQDGSVTLYHVIPADGLR